jgi:CubicO group peptidase (beta-lactamase class C family)
MIRGWWARLVMGLAALVGSASAAAAPAATDAQVARFFDDFVSRQIKSLEIPGGALVVVRNGRIVLAKGYGYADLASKRPVDVERTLFRAASISKLAPWLLVMQLVEEGKLDLDRDVNAYLDFRIPDAFSRPITMRHLMTHSAGFPERFNGVFDPDLSTPLGEQLRRNIPERVYAPGTTVAYSNYGAALAGYIVQRLRGEPWEKLVAGRLFRPVGMDHSTVAQPVPAAMQPFLASTYSWPAGEPGEFRTTPLAPMGSLTPTAGDMGRLLAMLLRGGQGERGRVLAPETLRQMFALQKPLGPGVRDGMGLGFLAGEYRGIRYAGHAGNMTTLATDLETLPDRGLGWYYVFTGQGPSEQAREVRWTLLKAAIDAFGDPAAARPRAFGPSSAAAVAGKYISTRRLFSGPLMFSGIMNTTEVEARADGSLDIESSGRISHWLPQGRDRFVESESGIPLAITRGRDGRVTRIASAELYPVAEFERAPGLVTWVPILAAFSFGTFLLALIVRPAAAFLARRRRKSQPAPREPEGLRRWARLAFRLLAATILAWGLFGLALAIDFAWLFRIPAIVRILLALLTMASAPLALILAADAFQSWRDPERGLTGRLGNSLVAAAAGGLAILFYRLDVINLSGAW